MTFDLPWEPLYPSQRSGALSLERAMWRGEERRFAVQWHEDRVYFRLMDGEPGVWATLDACEEGDALACFEEAVRSRRYGVCFSHKFDVYRHSQWMNLQFIYAPNGTGLLREWSSRDWLTFAPGATRMWPLLPDTVLPEEYSNPWRKGQSHGCCRAAIHAVEDELFFRRVGDEEIERLSWRSSTTQAEFERVMRWLWDTRIMCVKEPIKKWEQPSFCPSNFVPNPRSSLSLSGMRWRADEKFLAWLRGYFVGEGLEWRKTGYGKRRFRKLRAREPHLRAWFRPEGVVWTVEFTVDPTAHQQLEARLELRDWLRGKVPDARIEEWLGAHT